MSIPVTCPGCKKRYSVDEKLAGKKLRCKACGGVVVVPTPRAADEASDLDALMSVQEPSVVHQTPTPLPRVPTGATAVAQRVVVSTSRPEDPYVSFPGDQILNRFGPWVPIAIYLTFMGLIAVHSIREVLAMAEALHSSSYGLGRAVGDIIGKFIKFGIAAPAIYTLLCLGGVWLASVILKLRSRKYLYFKCLAVICTPMALSIAMSGFDLHTNLLAAPWWVSVLAMAAVLWLLFPLKPIPFAVVAAFALVPSAGLPLLLDSLTSASWHSTARGGSPPTAHSKSRQELKSDTDEEAAAVAVLRKISTALTAYRNAHEGDYPHSVQELRSDHLIDNDDIEAFRSCFGVLESHPGLKPPYPARVVVAYGILMRSSRRVVLFGDGRVESVELRHWGEVMIESMKASHHVSR